MEKKLYFALDVNDNFISLLALDIDKNGIEHVIAFSKVETRGYRTFEVTNKELFTNQLKLLVEEFETNHRISVGDVAVNIDTKQPTYSTRTKTIKFDEVKKIDKSDVSKCLDELKDLLTNDVKTAFCALPLSYRVNLENVSSPIGVKGSDLEVKALIVSSNSKELYDYLLSIEDAGLNIVEIAPSFISNIFESFTLNDNRKRTMLLDFGFKSSRVVFYDSGLLSGYKHFDFGIDDIKEELKNNLKISGESIHTLFELVYKNSERDLDQVITLDIDGEFKEINIIDIKIELNKILTQTFAFIDAELKNITTDYSIMLVTNVLADVENIVDIAQYVFKRETRAVTNNSSIFDDSTWTNSLGLIKYISYISSLYDININNVNIDKISYDKTNVQFVDPNETQEVEIRDKNEKETYEEVYLEKKEKKVSKWFANIKAKLFDNRTGVNDDE